MNLYEAGQIILTFPNSPNQLTVSRNPMLNAIKFQVGDKVIPDKMMSTIDRAHAEMTMTALGFDTLFPAPRPLVRSLTQTKTETKNSSGLKIEDDSDYMFVADLERNGSGVYHDGFTQTNCPINFDGTYINEMNNKHYYEYNGQSKTYDLRKVSPNIYAVSDAYWTFGPNGGEFIKDAQAIQMIAEIEARLRSKN